MSDETQHFTPRAKHVLALAQEMAEQQGSCTIDVEHLLVALLRNEDVARRFLQALAVGDTPLPLLLIRDENGSVLVANQPAQEMINDHAEELLKAISRTSTTTRLTVADRTYLAILGHLSDARAILMLHDTSHVTKLQEDMERLFWFLSSDLKSPLAAIKTGAEFLQKVAQESGNKQEQMLAETIDSTADGMVETINQHMELFKKRISTESK